MRPSGSSIALLNLATTVRLSLYPWADQRPMGAYRADSAFLIPKRPARQISRTVSCARESLPPDEAGCEEAPDLQYRRQLGEHAQAHSGKTDWALPESRPGLW